MIEAIVFDIGRVLVRLEPQPLLALLARHGASDHDLETLVMRLALHEHETGDLPGDALLERLAALAPAPIPSGAVRAAWLNMFELDRPMIELAHALAARHRVFLLSNIGDLHWMHLAREYGLHRIGHGALPSFLAGSMKPAAPIYAEAERRFALEPARTVFIDDRHDNIAAARQRGWHGIVHEDYARTRAALQRAGVLP
ncbi:MAG: HAD-IA family hydrolase [Gammaproteobacteria bacterium]|nr:HAD-IA family hydrolase [Gammaproteobacteria bacterium]